MALQTDTTGQIFPPWQLDRWKAVDDRVRGGSSTSHLDRVEGSSSAVRFWGHLDIDTLGGAGFASQRFVFAPEPLHLPRFKNKGILLRFHTASNSVSQGNVHTFTVVLKSDLSDRTQPPNLPPNPQPATLSYEANFSRPSGPSSSKTKSETIRLRLEDFEPTYRGKKVERSDPRYQPLHSEKIYEFSLMCRSGFGNQQGDFELFIEDIAKWEKESKAVWLLGILTGLWSRIVAFCVSLIGRQGIIMLDDEEKDQLLE